VSTDDHRILALTEAAAALAGRLDLEEVLRRIVAAAASLTGARYVALGVLGDDEHLAQFIHKGVDDETAERIGHLPTGRGILGVLIRDPAILRLHRLQDHPASVGFPADHPKMENFLGTPIRSGGSVWGNLYLTEKDGGFTTEDEVWIQLLAAQAGTAIENAELSRRLQDLAVQSERDRIGRDLHDGIIQTLFSIGMSLESAIGLLTESPDRAAQRIESAVDGIDVAIRELRNTIFHLRPNNAASLGLRDGIIELAREHEVNALVRPRLDLPADLNAHVPGAATPDLLQIVRETLSNVARHARAGEVTIRARTDGSIVLEIQDNGVGFEPTAPAVGRGLENMHERAAVLSATLEIDSASGKGTVVRLTLPTEESR
jgi:signal transduction histidine kinase